MRRLTGRHPSKSDAGGGWPVFILQMMDRGGRDYRHWQRPCESGSRYCEKKAPRRLDLCAAAVLMHVTGAALELLF